MSSTLDKALNELRMLEAMGRQMHLQACNARKALERVYALAPAEGNKKKKLSADDAVQVATSLRKKLIKK